MAPRSESSEFSGTRRFAGRVDGREVGAGRLRAALTSSGSPGLVLRDVRVHRRLDPEDISAALGVRTEYIEPVEADRGDEILGANRSMKLIAEYAAALGLDVQVIEDWFAGSRSYDEDHDEPEFPVARSESNARASLLFDDNRNARAVAVAFGRPVPKVDNDLRLRRFGVLFLLVGVLLSLISLYPQIL